MFKEIIKLKTDFFSTEPTAAKVEIWLLLKYALNALKHYAAVFFEYGYNSICDTSTQISKCNNLCTIGHVSTIV